MNNVGLLGLEFLIKRGIRIIVYSSYTVVGHNICNTDNMALYS